MTLGAGHKDLRIVGCAGGRVLSCCGVVRPPEWSDFLASHLLLCEELVYIREAAPDLTVYFWQEKHSRDGRDLLPFRGSQINTRFRECVLSQNAYEQVTAPGQRCPHSPGLMGFQPSETC